jgi:hypothetical protein
MAGIKHLFTSATPDGPNASWVRPSNWNEVHDIPASGIQIGDSVTNEMTAVQATGKLQLLQRNVLNDGYEFITQKSVRCTFYDFSRAASQTIVSPGTYAFNLTSLPPGVSATVFAPSYTIVNATDNGSGLIRIQVAGFHTYETGMVVVQSGVGGVAGANGTFVVTRIDINLFDLQGTSFTGIYTAGGTVQQRPHYLYLSAGTGTAEACPIISVAGTTVNLYVAQPKSGSYTISSATNGIQEAIYSSENRIFVPGGVNYVSGTLTIDGTFTPGVQIFGGTTAGHILVRRPTFTRGDVIRCINNSGTNIRDIGVYNISSVIITDGAAFSYRNGNTHASFLTNITVTDERVGLYIAGCNTISVCSFEYFQTPTIVALGNYCFAGLHVADGPWASNGNLQFLNCVFQGIVQEFLPPDQVNNQLDYAVKIDRADGIHFTNIHCKGKIGFYIARTDLSHNVGYVNVTNIELDGCKNTHIYIYADDYGYGEVTPSGAAAGAFQNIRFTNIASQQQRNPLVQLVFIGGLGIGEAGVQFSNCLFASSTKDNTLLQQTKHVAFNRCKFMNTNNENNANGYAIALTGSQCSNISFTSCDLDYLPAFGDFSYGIKFAAFQMTNITFNNNTVTRSISHGIDLFSGCRITNSSINNNIFNGLSKFVSNVSTIPTSISNAAAAVFRKAGHGLTTGRVIEVSGGTSAWVPINGTRTVTVIDSEYFSVPVDSSAFGAVSGTVSYLVYVNTIVGFGISLGGVVDGLTIQGNTFLGCGFGSIGTSAATINRLLLGENNYQETTQGTIASATTITLPTDNFLPLIPVSGTTSIATINGVWNRRRITLRTTGILSLTAAGNIARAFGPTVAGQTIDMIYDSATAKWYPN